MCGGPALCTARRAPAPDLCRAISQRLGWQLLAEAKDSRDFAPSGADRVAVTEGLADGGHADLGTLLTQLRERLEAAMPAAPSAAEAPDTPGGARAALAEYAEEVAAAAQAASRQASRDSEADDSADKMQVQAGGCADVREDWTALFKASLFEDLPSRLLARLSSLPFEARKDAMRVFAALLRCGTAAPEARGDIVGYIRDRPDIARRLLESCGCAEAVVVCGEMLRACCRHEELVEFLLGAGAALELVALTQNNSFDIAAEAFASLSELLLVQREVAAAYLERHFTEFFTAFNSMLQADDYVARRQGLRLLGEILLGSEFVDVMLRYVSNDRFLRLHMNLLLDTSPMVQLGAFHVVKIFVANPTKPLRVEQILRRNAARLSKRLEPLPAFRAEDECLGEDVRAVVGILRALSLESEGVNARSPFSSSGSFSSGTSTPTALDEPRVFDEPVAALEVTAATAY